MQRRGWTRLDACAAGRRSDRDYEDFAERAGRDPHGPIIVWLRIGNATNRALLEWLRTRWSEIIELLDSGNGLIEVRKFTSGDAATRATDEIPMRGDHLASFPSSGVWLRINHYPLDESAAKFSALGNGQVAPGN